LKDVIRTFIAIDLSPEIYQRLEEVIGQLKSRLAGVPVRWVGVKNIHLTLKFLGEVSQGNLEAIKDVLRKEASQHQSFGFSVAELGAFPSIRRPRVIWVGVNAPHELSALQRGIETELQRLGYPREERGFSPHLTLGRVSRECTSEDAKQIGAVLESYNPGLLGEKPVQAVRLYRSDLQPGGAVYTLLYSAALRS
jgi:2'-5' RNA ligase